MIHQERLLIGSFRSERLSKLAKCADQLGIELDYHTDGTFAIGDVGGTKTEMYAAFTDGLESGIALVESIGAGSDFSRSIVRAWVGARVDNRRGVGE